jgi:hypothetical protein
MHLPDLHAGGITLAALAVEVVPLPDEGLLAALDPLTRAVLIGVLVWYKLDEHRQRRNNHQPPKGPAKD